MTAHSRSISRHAYVRCLVHSVNCASCCRTNDENSFAANTFKLVHDIDQRASCMACHARRSFTCRHAPHDDAFVCLQNAAMILDNMIKDIVAACDHFDIERFIPRLAQFLAVPHVPHKRRFLIDWTSLLQSVPDIDMLLYLPELLDGMMTMLSDSHTEIRTATARTLDNFLRQVRACAWQLSNHHP